LHLVDQVKEFRVIWKTSGDKLLIRS